ncbi:unnamed protein product [Enterobius vermicularis]|uniref:Uncharacterized protein n=1 Tax=Enterobius vermicularis TaxID=51028 RepID=A0A0N4V693_ENTVE|nr:unnamed protein product [Enterobius vermicularis]
MIRSEVPKPGSKKEGKAGPTQLRGSGLCSTNAITEKVGLAGFDLKNHQPRPDKGRLYNRARNDWGTGLSLE